MASRSVDLGWSGRMSMCDVHICVARVCMHPLGAGELTGNLSALINAINLNTRVDNSPEKKQTLL